MKIMCKRGSSRLVKLMLKKDKICVKVHDASTMQLEIVLIVYLFLLENTRHGFFFSIL